VQLAPDPLPIQLCIQGGAAKRALLIAFMEAVEDLQKDQTLRVRHVAGTSAGAIAGTLFAAGIFRWKMKSMLNGGVFN
jgi:predicted acylesterase/phospholipase RssA